MPLIKIETLPDNGAWAVWHITETKETLWSLLDDREIDVEQFKEISHPQKQLEWLASRLLVQNLATTQQLPYHGICKDKYGKPHLEQSTWQMSLAHCYPFAVAAINQKGAIGIDIEKPKEKLLKIAPRFLSSSEAHYAKNDLELLCHYWTGKEALYKIYGRKQLIFKENIQLEPHSNEASQFRGRILTEDFDKNYHIHYQILSGHLIAYSREMSDKL